MRRYHAYGLSISSELVLPQFAELPASAAHATQDDVEILEGRVDWDGPPEYENRCCYDVTPERALINMCGVARYRVTGGCRIVIGRAAGASDGDVHIFLVSSALGALLRQRGRFVLHASAVSIDGAAAVLMGASGAGKSTLAAALQQAGAKVLCDDLCCVSDPLGAQPRIQPGYRSVKLWDDAACALAVPRSSMVRIRACHDKFYVSVGDSFETEPRPLKWLVLLSPAATGAPPSVRRIEGGERLQILLGNVFRPLWTERMGIVRDTFAQAASLAETTPMLEIERSEGTISPGDAAALLFSQLTALEPVAT